MAQILHKSFIIKCNLFLIILVHFLAVSGMWSGRGLWLLAGALFSDKEGADKG